jgi:hypothetical protein
MPDQAAISTVDDAANWAKSELDALHLCARALQQEYFDRRRVAWKNSKRPKSELTLRVSMNTHSLRIDWYVKDRFGKYSPVKFITDGVTSSGRPTRAFRSDLEHLCFLAEHWEIGLIENIETRALRMRVEARLLAGISAQIARIRRHRKTENAVLKTVACINALQPGCGNTGERGDVS